MKKQVKKISLNDTNNRYLDLDTETIHSGVLEENGNLLDIKDIIEISWKVLDCDGIEILGSKKGFIVKEFWEDKNYLYSKNYRLENKQIIETENFAINKIDYWQQKIDSGELLVKSWGAILKQLAKDIENYNITLFSAYNCLFDRQAIVSTSQLIPYKNYCKGLWELDFLDIMLIVNIFAKQKDFKKWADNHGAISSKGNYQCKAETLYRYLTNNNEELQTKVLDSCSWAESHIALEDIDCEGVILQAAISLSRRKREIKIEVNKYGNWSNFNSILRKANMKKVRKPKVIQLELLEN